MVIWGANDNELTDEGEHAKRLRTLARLARKGDVRPFDVVKTDDVLDREEHSR